jgi:hypothetical protein
MRDDAEAFNGEVPALPQEQQPGCFVCRKLAAPLAYVVASRKVEPVSAAEHLGALRGYGFAGSDGSADHDE